MAGLTSEQVEIRDLAREFARRELRPHAARRDTARALDDEVLEALAEVGFLGMLAPEAHGGLGLEPETYLLVLEELAWGDAAVALSVAVHNGAVADPLAERGSPAQREAWLPRLARGEMLGALALAEDDAGDDPAALRTLALREGDDWVLSGTKTWVTNGARAGLVLVFARTDREGGIGAFLVEPSAEGYRVLGRRATMGLRASESVDVRLDGVRVGAGRLLGGEACGLAYAAAVLDLARAGAAAQAVGVARAAMEHAAAYAVERVQFGRPIAGFGAVQDKLAGMAVRIAGARALTREAGRRLRDRREGNAERGMEAWDTVSAAVSAAKLTAGEAATWVADEAVQIFGGYGYMRDYPVEKLMRDAKGLEVCWGTADLLRGQVARDVIDAAGSHAG
jgi:alkylation response protein AidB-like acyl-CoA dehydrogenase